MISGQSWQDYSKDIRMICMVPYNGQIMMRLVGKPGLYAGGRAPKLVPSGDNAWERR